MGGIDNPLQSIEDTIAFDSRDWSSDKRLAWIYGVVNGWENEEEGEDPDSIYKELQREFKWTNETVERLKRLHNTYAELQALHSINN